ncbi:MAG: methylated-DNA--[protein]-cysteine S-methyltransferase [Betaproteobacteria bacterium]|nr:methylated-DNA--[protein]-cysteine S-methyltransferase [Betaproteobacteria bacterium]MDH5352374.1 methylated-DNA--[protein]-cysteine S-methyltransferase [Betaproteobacteria bacterium]
MTYYDHYSTPQGRMLLVADEHAITRVSFAGQKYAPRVARDWIRDGAHPPIARAKRELAEYFAGRRKRFSVKLAPQGTPFQRKVWKAIAGVGFGKTIAYAELARRAGRPGSARAAGAATGRNPIGVIVPCHRIVGADGSLTGYAGGLAKKKALLALEARG